MNYDWKAALRTIAPTLASAFGGPLAGMAVTAIGNALGIDEPTQEKVEQALSGATQEDMLKLKQADQQFAKDMRALDVDLERIAGADRDSARRMQTETKSKIPGMLAGLVTFGFFGILVGMLTGDLDTKGSPELLLLIGSLSTSWGMVVSFYFGSTANSRTKDDTIQAISTRKP
jgi:hypothetical protein